MYIAENLPNALSGATVREFVGTYSTQLLSCIAAGGRYLWLISYKGRNIGLANVYLDESEPLHQIIIIIQDNKAS